MMALPLCPRTVCCYVCGSRVSPTGTEDSFLDGKEEWLKARAKKVYCQADELDEMPISDCHWTQFFRVIYRIPQSGQFRLSGIGQYAKYQEPYVLPRHRDRCVIGPMRRPNEHRIVTRLARLRSTQLPERKRVLVGYAVHSRCWQLVERIIGRGTAETHLGVLMKVLLRRFGELGFGAVRFLKSTENEQDPYTSKAVREIIATSFRRRRHEVHQSPRLVCRPASVLPLEIQWAILDLLGMDDIITKLRTIEWPISDVYWRSRVPTRILFEMEDYPECSLDWEYICVSLTKLELSGLFDWFRSRQRVVGVIERTRDIFDGALESNKG